MNRRRVIALPLGLVTAAVCAAGVVDLVPSAGAYVNGGVFHSTLKDYEKRLKTNGWGVSFAAPLAADCDRTKVVAEGVKVAPPDNARYQRYVNQLVGRALKALPAKDAARISTRAKREVARLTRAALQKGVANKEQVIQKGQTGALQYRVGAYGFETWWETNYGGKRETHEKRAGLAPFVALKVVAAKGQTRQQP
jgi:hypothetical protein